MIGLEQSRGGKTNRRVSLQTSCLPVVSHGTALRRLGLWRHSACFARQVSLTKNGRPKYAKPRFNACFLDNKSSFSFRYNKQLIAQLVGRHENLFNPENWYLPRATWMFWVEQIFMSPSKLGNKCILLYSLCFSPTAIGGALSCDQKLSDHINWKWAFSLNTSTAKSFASAFQVNIESAPN